MHACRSRQTTALLSAAASVLLLVASAAADEGVAIGDLVRIVTHDTEVIEGEIIDETPGGYMVRVSESRVSYVAYRSIMAIKRPRAESEIDPEPEVLATPDPESVRFVEREKPPSRPPPEWDSASAPVAHEPLDDLDRDVALTLQAGFQVVFWGDSVGRSSVSLDGLFGGSIRIGADVRPAWLSPAVQVGIAANQTDGAWDGLPESVESSTVNRIEMSVYAIHIAPELDLVLGLNRDWIVRPFFGIGGYVGIIAEDYGGATALTYTADDQTHYARDPLVDDREIAGGFDLHAGFRIWKIYIRGDVVAGYSMGSRISVGMSLP